MTAWTNQAAIERWDAMPIEVIAEPRLDPEVAAQDAAPAAGGFDAHPYRRLPNFLIVAAGRIYS
jgi:hypothetical protein